MNLKSIYEAYHGVKIEEKLIDKIIELSDRYIYDRCEPDKSIDILSTDLSILFKKADGNR